MTQKPALFGPDNPPSTPPRPLATAGQQLWNKVQQEYNIVDAGGIELLQQCCEALDRTQELSEIIKREGLTIETRVGTKDHPLLKHELACRAFIARGLQRLGLNLEPVRLPGRPPSSPYWKG